MLNLSKQGKSLWQRFKPDKLHRNLGISFGESFLSKGLNFLIILVLARMLGPSDYGKYSFIFVTMAFCSALFDFGMDNTAIRFASRDKDKRFAIFGLYLLIKLVVLNALILFFILGGDWLLLQMGKPEMAPYIPFLIMGMLGESLFLVNDVWLLANQQYAYKAILTIARYAAALGYVVILLTEQWFLLQIIFWVYAVPLFFCLLFVGRYIEFLKAYFKEGVGKERLKEMQDYQKGMFGYSIANNLIGRVDFFLLAVWVTYDQLGVYNAAVQLCGVVSFLPIVFGKVLLPTLSEMPPEKVVETSGKVNQSIARLCLAGLLLIPFCPWVIPLLLGADYVEAIPILQILLAGVLTTLMVMVYEQSLYAMGRPQILSTIRYIHLALMIVLHLLTIPQFGIMAAAVNTLLGRIVYLIFVWKIYQGIAARYLPVLPANAPELKPLRVEEQPG